MLVRAAIVMASMLMAGQALAADKPPSVPVGQAPAQVASAPAGFGQLADADESAPHAQELKRIAVYAAIGNRDGVEIASRQLRQFGVTADEVQEAIDRTRLHGDGTGKPLMQQSHGEFGRNPAMKVSY